MVRPLMFLLLAVSLAFAAPVPKELKRTDEQAILGTWDMVAHSNNGEVPTPQTVKWRLEPNGKAFIMNPADTALEYKLHPELSPRGFDWQWPGNLHLGLYALEGDTLKVVITTGASKVRPTELKPAPGMIYCEFKRVAPTGEPTKPRKPEIEK